jgi:hypothetical protein
MWQPRTAGNVDITSTTPHLVLVANEARMQHAGCSASAALHSLCLCRFSNDRVNDWSRPDCGTPVHKRCSPRDASQCHQFYGHVRAVGELRCHDYPQLFFPPRPPFLRLESLQRCKVFSVKKNRLRRLTARRGCSVKKAPRRSACMSTSSSVLC